MKNIKTSSLVIGIILLILTSY